MGKTLTLHFVFKLNDKTRFRINENCSYNRFFSVTSLLAYLSLKTDFKTAKGLK